MAFATFDKAYVADIKSILFATGTTAANQRPAFDQAVAALLTTLNSTIDSDVSNLPAQASLSSTIQPQITGGNATSLQSELAALVTPIGPGTASASAFQVKSQVQIAKAGVVVESEVLTSPTGLITASTLLGDLGKVASAFSTFSHTDGSDVKTILLATDTPSDNRPAFDAAIASALNTLNTSIDTTLSNLPTSVSGPLETKIQNALTSVSSSSNSLEDQLGEISTPLSNGFVASLIFNVASKIKIASSGVTVAGDIGSAVHQYNFAS
jgi:hypothetical protein